MKQRVGVARALAVSPQTLLMDEPLAALDAITRSHLGAELLRIWERDRRTVVFVTHSLDEALVLSDRVILLRDGVVFADTPVDLPPPSQPEHADRGAGVPGSPPDLEGAPVSTPERTAPLRDGLEEPRPPVQEAALRTGRGPHRDPSPLGRRENPPFLRSPRPHLHQLFLLAVILGVWEYVGRNSEEFAFAPPSSVVPAAREMISSGELGNAMTDSLVALLLGFALAALAGVGIGYAMGWWKTVGRTLDPFVAAVFVVPIASLVPVIIVWLGLGLASQVLVIFLFAVFEILLNSGGPE